MKGSLPVMDIIHGYHLWRSCMDDSYGYQGLTTVPGYPAASDNVHRYYPQISISSINIIYENLGSPARYSARPPFCLTDRSPARPLVRSFARLLARPLTRQLARGHARPLPRLLARSLDRSLTRWVVPYECATV